MSDINSLQARTQGDKDDRNGWMCCRPWDALLTDVCRELFPLLNFIRFRILWFLLFHFCFYISMDIFIFSLLSFLFVYEVYYERETPGVRNKITK